MPHPNTESPAPGRPHPAGQPWPVAMADSALARYGAAQPRWHYEDGLLIRAILEVGRTLGAGEKYRQVAIAYADRFVEPDGGIRTYRPDDYNLDQIQPGRLLIALYRETGEERYRRAIDQLREQLRRQPRTAEGGFWHKRIYPHQMWLDGIYMAGPFLARYGAVFGDAPAFDDVANQILLIARHTRDARSGLLYHAWDESRGQQWADPHTGCSPHFWGRAVGWYLMAVVDVLDVLPPEHPTRPEIVGVLDATVRAVCAVQDAESGLWYQVLDQGARPGNYLEASASCMFVYGMAKAAARSYLGPDCLAAARLGYEGILARLVEVDAAGRVNLHGICVTAGLGGAPYRDGSFGYYTSEKIVTNDYKGVGAFILAGLEIEQASNIHPRL